MSVRPTQAERPRRSDPFRLTLLTVSTYWAKDVRVASRRLASGGSVVRAAAAEAHHSEDDER